ncbi:MAG: MaoC family dehydratase N-terminal domain-containing protein [Deltaproteobacteria bacterium]|nr:MaoC family dehydratase N-terminal domain-containing protein [Deltaproteobacteria bacterium]
MIKLDPAQIGQEVLIATVTVTADDIRKFAEAVGDLNPLYLDADAARAAGYPNVIAPPLFCMKMRGGRMRPDVPLEPGYASLHAGQDLEFVDEICAGQTYTITAKVAEAYEKTGRSGPMGIVVREVAIKDATGRVAVTLRERQIVRSAERKI